MTIFRSATVGIVTIAALAMSGCSGLPTMSSGIPGLPGGDDGATLVFGTASAPKQLDPFYAADSDTLRITRQVFEGLLTVKPGTAEVVPGLAAELPTSRDGKAWTFKLRSGVKFHDGTPFNADAVCKNFERMFNQNPDAQKGPAAYWSYAMGAFKDKAAQSLYKGCATQNATTVVLTVNTATSKFPTLLSLASFAMQSPTAMAAGKANEVKAQGNGFSYPEYSQAPVGTGPFTFDEYDRADKTITLVKNDDYWGDKAKVDKLVFTVIPNESSRRAELKAGNIDGYDVPDPADWKALKADGNQVLVRPPFNILYLGLNPAKNPELKDIRVRQAIYHALNRDELVRTQLPAGATVATQFMPESVHGHAGDVETYAYDVDKAKALLEDAGAEGMTLTLAYPSEVSRPYMPNPKKIHEALRADLEAVGIEVEVATKPWNAGYLDAVDAGAFDAWLLGWTGDYDSADNFIGTFFQPSTNDFHTKDLVWGAKLSEDLRQADAVVDPAKRAAAYEQLNRRIMADYLPGLPLTHAPTALVVGKNVKGVVASPVMAELFSDVTVIGT